MVWKKRKLADGSALKLDQNGSPVLPDDINHLDIFSKQDKEVVEEEKEDTLGIGKHGGIITKKNFALNSANSLPICFAVKFTNQNRTAKKNLTGHGTKFCVVSQTSLNTFFV